ncbi:hypothetical protein MNBD_ALPHA06-1884 [hydrothermal vent metagenome]|uniref:Uncharacterized protein n=1 Tax=hydrothermal vent metagenome TaxID=652676 RepID=A0A3B0SA63_9ZZZZ
MQAELQTLISSRVKTRPILSITLITHCFSEVYKNFITVIPAEAGIQNQVKHHIRKKNWTPAYAGVTYILFFS